MENLSVLHFKGGADVNQTYICKTSQLVLILKAFSLAKIQKIQFENPSDKQISPLCHIQCVEDSPKLPQNNMCSLFVWGNVMLMIE